MGNIKKLLNTLRSIKYTFFLAMILLAIACSKPDQEEKKQPPLTSTSEIIIGVITPDSGEHLSYGDATKKGLLLALEEINQNGGLNGRKLSLIIEDSKLSAQAGNNAVQKLIKFDKVPVIIGAFGSSVTLAIAPEAERNKVVLFSASSTDDKIKFAGDYIFRNVPTNSEQGKIAARYLVEKKGINTAAILFENNDYGGSLKKAFVNEFRELGGEILIEEKYSPKETNFKSQLGKIKIKKPQVVFFPGHSQESASILVQAKELGVKSLFMGGDGSYSPTLIEIARNAAENSYYTLMAIGYNVSDSEIEKYNKAFKAKYGEEPDVYSAYAYDALKMIAKAIEIGGYSSDGIKDSLYNMGEFIGVTGITKFDEYGETKKPFYVYKVSGGKFILAE